MITTQLYMIWFVLAIQNAYIPTVHNKACYKYINNTDFIHTINKITYTYIYC